MHAYPRNVSSYKPRNLSCYYQYEEYVKQVEVKQSDDIYAEVDDEKNVDVTSRLIVPSRVRVLPLAAGINVGGHSTWHYFSFF
jgi:hypothetical protein